MQLRMHLLKDGWTITADPLTIRFGGIEGQIDLEAEKSLVAEKQGRVIAVEIKSFSAPSGIIRIWSCNGTVFALY